MIDFFVAAENHETDYHFLQKLKKTVKEDCLFQKTKYLVIPFPKK